MLYTPPPDQSKAIAANIHHIDVANGYLHGSQFCHPWPGHKNKYYCTVDLGKPNASGLRCFRAAFWFQNGSLRINTNTVVQIPCLKKGGLGES